MYGIQQTYICIYNKNRLDIWMFALISCIPKQHATAVNNQSMYETYNRDIIGGISRKA